MREDAKREGIEQGIERGIGLGIEGIAQKMLEANRPIAEIMQFTGISAERLNELSVKHCN